MVDTHILKRIDVVPDSLAVLDEQLAEDAYSLFRYRPARAVIEATRTEREVLRRLLEMGIHPFTSASVQRYKDAQLGRRWFKMFALLALGVAMGAGGAWVLVATSGNSGVLGGALLIAAIVLCITAPFYFQPANWSWRRVLVSDYDLPIPSHVLARAVQIHHAFNGSVALHVDALYLTRQISDPDPFLVVVRGETTIYVDVWDEPSFTAPDPSSRLDRS